MERGQSQAGRRRSAREWQVRAGRPTAVCAGLCRAGPCRCPGSPLGRRPALIHSDSPKAQHGTAVRRESRRCVSAIYGGWS